MKKGIAPLGAIHTERVKVNAFFLNIRNGILFMCMGFASIIRVVAVYELVAIRILQNVMLVAYCAILPSMLTHSLRV